MAVVAYSYVRFSSTEQAEGDSLRRQRKAAVDYAARHGLVLDETYRDEGVSGHTGKHVSKGAFGRFVKAVKDGRVPPGSWLLIEAWDRFSRQDHMQARRLFDTLLERGITIATLEGKGEVYDEESCRKDVTKIITVVVKMQSAFEFSERLGGRLRSAWQGKREAAATEKLTKWCPAWLRLKDDRSEYEENEDRFAVVELIFELYVGGLGYDGVARELNARGVPTWEGIGDRVKANGWSIGYVQRILKNPAVVGVYQPKRRIEVDGLRRDVADGDPVPDYFPAAIPRALWDRALAVRALRGDGKGGKGGTGGPKRKSLVCNLFTGMLQCMSCFGPLEHQSKGYRRADAIKPRSGIAVWQAGHYLCCSNARRKVPGRNGGLKCAKAEWVRYATFERGVLDGLEGVLLDPPRRDDAEERRLEARTGALRDEIGRKRAAIDDAILSAAGKPERLAAVERVEARLEADKEELAKLERERSALRGRGSPATALAAVAALRGDAVSPDPEVRLPARLRLAEALKTIMDRALVYVPTGKAVVEYGGAFRMVVVDGGRVFRSPEDDYAALALVDGLKEDRRGHPRAATLRALLRRMEHRHDPDGTVTLSFDGGGAEAAKPPRGGEGGEAP